jgi:acyl carrier protein
VCWSSIAGVWGSAEHAAYAAANAYLDAFAQHRAARGLPATSVAWGVWAAANPWDPSRTIDGIDNDDLRGHGLALMDPERALALLGRTLDHGRTLATVADVDWDRFVPVFNSARPRPLLADLAEAEPQGRTVTVPETDASAPSELLRRLARAPEGDRHRVLVEAVRTHAAAVLGYGEAEEIEPSRPFKELGFDSVTAIDLRNRLMAVTGVRLPATLVFDHPTPAALARFLHAELAPGQEDASSALAALDRLRRVLTETDPRGADGEAITGRLRALLRSWRKRAGDGADADDLGSATDAELFDLLDHELGRS